MIQLNAEFFLEPSHKNGPPLNSHTHLDAFPELSRRIGRDGILRNVESAAGKSGFDKEILQGSHIYEVFPDKNADRIMDHVNRAFESGKIQTFRLQLPMDNSLRSFEVRVGRRAGSPAHACLSGRANRPAPHLKLCCPPFFSQQVLH